MNRPRPPLRPSRLLALAWLVLWPLTAHFSALGQATNAPAGGGQRPEPERFLFIIDVGSDMQKRATNVQRVVHQLFATGFQGQLRPGDTIGMWTYNNELHTGQYPLQRWLPRVAREISVASVQFVQDLRYDKRSRLEPVLALASVVADSDRITVILISDGEEAPVGTPFDQRIAETFKLYVTEQRRLTMPFVTILRAVQGRYVGVKVNTPPFPLEFPAYPDEASNHKSTSTDSPPPKTETPPPPPPVKPAVTTEPKPTVTETNPPVTAPTNPPVVSTPPPPLATPTNPAPVAINTQTSPPRPQTLRQRQPSKPIRWQRHQPLRSTRGPNAPPDTRRSLVPLLAGVGIVLTGLAILSLALWKRSRAAPRVSLITRSMNKDRK